MNARNGTHVILTNAPPPRWFLLPSVYLFAIVTGGLLNISVLVTFANHRRVRSSFDIYIMNLLIINIIIAVVYAPFNLVEKYHSKWTLGYHACVLRWYTCPGSSKTFSSLPTFSSLLTAFGRLSFPSHTAFTTIQRWLLSCVVPRGSSSTFATFPRPSCRLSSLHPCLMELSNAPSISLLQVFGVRSRKLCCMIFLFYSLYQPTRSFATIHFLLIVLNSLLRKPSADSTVVQANQLPYRKVSMPVKLYEQVTEIRYDSRKLRCAWGRTLNGSLNGFVTLSLMTLSLLVCLMSI